MSRSAALVCTEARVKGLVTAHATSRLMQCSKRLAIAWLKMWPNHARPTIRTLHGSP